MIIGPLRRQTLRKRLTWAHLVAARCQGWQRSCTVLYCTVLYCTVLYCTVLCCTVLYYTLLYQEEAFLDTSPLDPAVPWHYWTQLADTRCYQG